jgi:hypothetical protein
MHLDPTKLGITAERAQEIERSLSPFLDDPDFTGKLTLMNPDGSETVILDRTPKPDELTRWRRLYEYVTHPLFVARLPVVGLAGYSGDRVHGSNWGLSLLVCGMLFTGLMNLQADDQAAAKKRRYTKALFTSTSPGGMMVPEHGTRAPGDPDDPEAEAGLPHVQGG